MAEVLELNKREISKISVVCPYYNEETIIKDSAKRLVGALKTLPYAWEVILVNDGSTDRSFEQLREEASDLDNTILITYSHNKGRGYALKRGIERASGDIIVTTEIDLSWGEDIVQRIVKKFEQEPDLDCVIASPNLRGGKYKKVPLKRVFVSKLGNLFIRLFFVPGITMNTGMTRGYRREIIQGIHTEERDKEFHLEVLLKIYNLAYSIGEIPATLEWRDHKDKFNNKKIRRMSKSRVSKLMKSHLKFMFLARPNKYFWAVGFFLMGMSLGFLGYGIYRLLMGQASIYMAIVSLSFAIFSLLFFVFGVIADQNIGILKELWRKK